MPLIFRRSDRIVHRFQNDGFKRAKLGFDIFNGYAKGGGGLPAHIGKCRGAGGIAALFTVGHVLVNPALHKLDRAVTHPANITEEFWGRTDTGQSHTPRAPLPEQRAILIQIGGVEIRQLDEPLEIVENNLAAAEGQKPLFTQLPQDAVDMHRTQPQRIGQHVLR